MRREYLTDAMSSCSRADTDVFSEGYFSLVTHIGITGCTSGNSGRRFKKRQQSDYCLSELTIVDDQEQARVIGSKNIHKAFKFSRCLFAQVEIPIS